MHRYYSYHPQFIGKGSGTKLKTAFEKAYPVAVFKAAYGRTRETVGTDITTLIIQKQQKAAQMCYTAKTILSELLNENSRQKEAPLRSKI